MQPSLMKCRLVSRQNTDKFAIDQNIQHFGAFNKDIKTHRSESRGQGGRSMRRPDGLETHAREYYTATRVVKIENAITKNP